jgi:uncharacterized protein (DUF2062 family)
MIHLTRALVRRWLDALLHIDDTPQRTAAAFAVGVFFGFSPFLGLHTVLGVLCAFMFDFNRVAVLLGVYSNLPWFLGPYYVITTMVGAEITGRPLPHGFRADLRTLFELSLVHGEFWHRLMLVLKPLVWPYTVGSLLGSMLLAAAAYQVALAFVTSRRKLHNLIHHHHHDTSQ